MLKFNGEQVSVLYPILVGEKFSKSELKQRSLPLDGQFDDLWNGCVAPGVPASCTVGTIPLLFLDQTFGIIHTTSDFDEFMEQTSDGRYDSNEKVTQLLIEQFARGINLDEEDEHEEVAFFIAYPRFGPGHSRGGHSLRPSRGW